MTDNERVFNELKREGEHWYKHYEGDANPDFSTPEGFFWMWDRLKEKKWFEGFCLRHSTIMGGKFIDRELINPTALYQAVLSWVRGEK